MRKLFPDFMLTQKHVLLIGILLFCLTSHCWSQTASLPEDHPIVTAAPHLPSILKFNGNVNGLKYTVYISEQEEATIREWAANYPEEIKSYKSAISTYLESSDLSTLSEGEKVLFYDLQAQLPKITAYCPDND